MFVYLVAHSDYYVNYKFFPAFDVIFDKAGMIASAAQFLVNKMYAYSEAVHHYLVSGNS